MKQTLSQKKLAGYSLAAGSIIIGVQAATGQVIHVDINPDMVLTNGMSYNVDISGDTKFTIRQLKYSVSWSSAALTNQTISAYFAGSSYTTSGVLALNLNDNINAQTLWGQFTSSSNWNLASYDISSSSGGGNFLGTTGKYIGMKFDSSGNTLYGWIQVDVNSDASRVTITGYGYNDTPDGQINAGQIPEPVGLGLLACGAAGLLALRNKQQKST